MSVVSILKSKTAISQRARFAEEVLVPFEEQLEMDVKKANIYAKEKAETIATECYEAVLMGNDFFIINEEALHGSFRALFDPQTIKRPLYDMKKEKGYYTIMNRGDYTYTKVKPYFLIELSCFLREKIREDQIIISINDEEAHYELGDYQQYHPKSIVILFQLTC